jgi:hypothetical protein
MCQRFSRSKWAERVRGKRFSRYSFQQLTNFLRPTFVDPQPSVVKEAQLSSTDGLRSFRKSQFRFLFDPLTFEKGKTTNRSDSPSTNSYLNCIFWCEEMKKKTSTQQIVSRSWLDLRQNDNKTIHFMQTNTITLREFYCNFFPGGKMQR